eukprot:7209912-Alexandrium_andersonii.AAC.1
MAQSAQTTVRRIVSRALASLCNHSSLLSRSCYDRVPGAPLASLGGSMLNHTRSIYARGHARVSAWGRAQ